MGVKQHLHVLLQKQMTRQEFLKTAGLALLAVTGAGRVLDVVSKGGVDGAAANTATQQTGTAYGYGMSVYEGIKR